MIVRLTEEYEVSVEMYSEETGFAFQEHYYIDKGKIICDECVDYIEICVDDLDEEEIEEEIDNQRMTTEEFMSHVEDGYFRCGGFSDWNFPNMKKYCITPINVDANTLSNLLEV